MPKTLERIEIKRFESPDEVRTFDKGKVELVRVGGSTVGRVTFRPGWRWSTCVKPLVGTRSCEEAHLGYLVSGTIVTRMDDGTEIECKSGDVVSIPPGHDGWVVGHENAVVIDFAGMKSYAKR
jgi:hypothetical protein